MKREQEQELNDICLGVNHIQGMAEAIEELTWQEGPEFTKVNSIAVGIATLADKVATMIEKVEKEAVE